MPKTNKPKIYTKCVANHYTHPNETIAEFTGGGVGGLLSLRDIGNRRLQLFVYRQDAGVEVAVAGHAVISKDNGDRTDRRKNILAYLAEVAEKIQVAEDGEIDGLARVAHGYLSGWLKAASAKPQSDVSGSKGSPEGTD